MGVSAVASIIGEGIAADVVGSALTGAIVSGVMGGDVGMGAITGGIGGGIMNVAGMGGGVLGYGQNSVSSVFGGAPTSIAGSAGTSMGVDQIRQAVAAYDAAGMNGIQMVAQATGNTVDAVSGAMAGLSQGITTAGQAAFAPVTSGSLGGTYTIPKGTPKQVKILVVKAAYGGTFLLNAVSGNVAANVILNATGDAATLLFTDDKWFVIGGRQR